MANEGAFLVEDFVNAITTQLDRVQDALRLKAVNRPLTYALKDLSLELKVFVDLDNGGNVRFRSAGPNETGASVVQLGFTTITKPMIEENTVSLSATRSASLQELGLTGEEQQRLERMGVRNLAQLNNLGSTAGMSTVSRLTDVPVDRLRTAIQSGLPRVDAISPVAPATPRITPSPVDRAPPVRHTPAQPDRTPVRDPGFVTPPGSRQTPAANPIPVVAPRREPPINPPILKLNPSARRVALFGANLADGGALPEVRLNAEPLSVVEADSDRLVVELPESHRGGVLEVGLPHGEVIAYELAMEEVESTATPWGDEGNSGAAALADWAPLGDRR